MEILRKILLIKLIPCEVLILKILQLLQVYFILFIYDPIKISFYEFFLITVASILINIAIYLATLAFKTAQKHYSSIFCLVYLQIIWSSLIGIFVFNEFLNLFAYIGASLIILSGIISVPGQLKQINE